MRFVLHYRGPLRSNGDALHKHQIREVLHRQLAMLWSQTPLRETWHHNQGPDGAGGFSLTRQVGPAVFVPLVTRAFDSTAELRITMLRPGRPGGVLSQGGDIDNRLKTLFDALSMPQANQIPAQAAGSGTPTYCLLEDDSLVTLVEVRAEQLLEEVNPSHVDLSIAVRTRIATATWSNDHLA
jgi:hypothetical protein